MELIGAAGRKADLEMSGHGSGRASRLRAQAVSYRVGPCRLFRDLAGRMDMPAEAMEQMRVLIEGKNFAALGDMLEPYAGSLPVRPSGVFPDSLAGQRCWTRRSASREAAVR